MLKLPLLTAAFTLTLPFAAVDTHAQGAGWHTSPPVVGVITHRHLVALAADEGGGGPGGPGGMVHPPGGIFNSLIAATQQSVMPLGDEDRVRSRKRPQCLVRFAAAGRDLVATQAGEKCGLKATADGVTAASGARIELATVLEPALRIELVIPPGAPLDLGAAAGRAGAFGLLALRGSRAPVQAVERDGRLLLAARQD